MTERGSVCDLFSPDELLSLMQFDFNVPVDGLINLKVAPPYGISPYSGIANLVIYEQFQQMLDPNLLHCHKCGVPMMLHPTINCSAT